MAVAKVTIACSCGKSRMKLRRPSLTRLYQFNFSVSLQCFYFTFFMSDVTHAGRSIISYNSRKCPCLQKFNKWLNVYELDSTTDFISSILCFQWVVRYAQIHTVQTYYLLYKQYIFGAGGQTGREETSVSLRQAEENWMRALHLPSLTSLFISGLLRWRPERSGCLGRWKAVS